MTDETCQNNADGYVCTMPSGHRGDHAVLLTTPKGQMYVTAFWSDALRIPHVIRCTMPGCAKVIMHDGPHS